MRAHYVRGRRGRWGWRRRCAGRWRGRRRQAPQLLLAGCVTAAQKPCGQHAPPAPPHPLQGGLMHEHVVTSTGPVEGVSCVVVTVFSRYVKCLHCKQVRPRPSCEVPQLLKPCLVSMCHTL